MGVGVLDRRCCSSIPRRLWVTVHDTDDEAARIWRDVVGVAENRIQRLGDETNLWKMADTGPCGYNSEVFLDSRRPSSVPRVAVRRKTKTATSSSGISVFMQYDQREGRQHAQAVCRKETVHRHRRDTVSSAALRRAGERRKTSIWDIDSLFRPLIARPSRARPVWSYHGFPGGERDDVRCASSPSTRVR